MAKAHADGKRGRMNKELEMQIHKFAEQMYNAGYNAGTSDRSPEIQKAYERGLNDAWECAKKIYNDNSFFVNEEIFGKGRSHFGKITDDYSASEAIAKMKEYEKQTNPISIDEAINNLKHGSSIKRETLTLAIKALEQMKGAKE